MDETSLEFVVELPTDNTEAFKLPESGKLIKKFTVNENGFIFQRFYVYDSGIIICHEVSRGSSFIRCNKPIKVVTNGIEFK